MSLWSCKNVKNPISLARSLSILEANNFLVGRGAEAYASKHGLEMANILTDRAKIHLDVVDEMEGWDYPPF